MNDAVGFSHIGICVQDLAASRRFYCEGLGFEPLISFELNDADMVGLDRALEVTSPVQVTSEMIERDGLRLELLGFVRPAPTGEPSTSRARRGLTHLCFQVDDVAATAERLAGLGGVVLESTRVNVGVDICFVADPDGTRVELMSR
jgi:lactoylglutathione lyase